jgi:16S rRNA (cytosine967-C5)-methyltransferase
MNPNEERIPLWRQLQACASVIQSVREGVSGTAAIDAAPEELRPAVQALAFAAWRNMGRAEAIRKILANKAPPAAVDALLCVSLALVCSDQEALYDGFTLVNQAVEAAKRQIGTRAQANFLNACLRRFLREHDDLITRVRLDEVAVWNHPRWWIEKIRREQPLQWQNILRAANVHAPMTLRVNKRQVSVADYLLELNEHGIEAHGTPDGAVILYKALPVHKIPGFMEGRVSVQDAAAQVAAPLLLHGLPNTHKLHILDACAAPGGKTGHLLEITDGQVTALELDPRRAARIHQNLARLGLAANVVTADALNTRLWWDGVQFDAILLDAPCSGSGVVRRHPDIRWLRRESDIQKLAELQKKMLQTLWALLKPGGQLLYCTCSVFSAEGSGQMQSFLARNTDATLLPSPGHLLPENIRAEGAVPDNSNSDHDGFYYALLQKLPT